MPRGSIVRSFLGEAGARIQRLLDLDALVSPQYETEEKILPVIIIGDGDRPGMGNLRGRRFVVSSIAGAGLGAQLWVDANQTSSVQIDVITVATDLAGNTQLRFMNAAVVAGLGAGTADGQFLDRATTAELPPFRRSTAGAGAGLTVQNFFLAANSSLQIAMPHMLVPGVGWMALNTNAAASVTITFYGRLF